jgi:hypothetical protein
MLGILCLVSWIGGCSSLPPVATPVEETLGKTTQETERKGPKTLLEWTLGKTDDKEKGNENNGKDKESREKGKELENGEDGTYNEGDTARDSANGGNTEKEKQEEPKRIDTDRPHLPEASTTVGLGRAVLEAGYTYNTSGGFFPLHSFPEAVLRLGVLADWFELRIGQNVASLTTADEVGVRSTTIGAEDLQLGVKLALTEQQKCLPESALVLQMTVPTGSKGFTANRVLPGIHYDCGWEVIKDLLAIETVVFADGSVDDRGHTFTLLGHGVTAAYDLTKSLQAFGELDSFYATGESAAPQHFFVAGLVYYLTRNSEIDIRAGAGLNKHADGYLIGSGFSVRY